MDGYADHLRKLKSLLIVTSLQKRRDLQALAQVEALTLALDWTPQADLMIAPATWEYVVRTRGYDPKLVFCHPKVLLAAPTTSLYYRGLTGLSIKAAKGYVGSIEGLEVGKPGSKLRDEKALKMAQLYNTFICTVIQGTADWTLEDGKRTVIATLGITLDGIMRNQVGSIAEARIRSLVWQWLQGNDLILSPTPSEAPADEEPLPTTCELKGNIVMRFASEPDIAFFKRTHRGLVLAAVVEIKGGTDPAGALERYGAATKSFQHALSENPRCKNFFLSAIYTDELTRRIEADRLVERPYDIIELLEQPNKREEFLQELFHYGLRLV